MDLFETDLEEDTGNYQEMGDFVQRACLVQDRGIFSKNFLDPGIPLPNFGGVTALEKNTEGGFSHFLLSRLKINGPPTPDDSSSQVPPPRSPPSGANKMALLSPVTPLEWLGSPVKPWKRLKGVSAEEETEEIAVTHPIGMAGHRMTEV